MHAAEAAGRHHPDLDLAGDEQGPGNGGGAQLPARQDPRQVSGRAFRDLRRLDQPREHLRAQANVDLTVDRSHGGRDGALIADRLLEFDGDCGVVRTWQAVADQGRLERHDALAPGQSLRDLREKFDDHGQCDPVRDVGEPGFAGKREYDRSRL